MKQTSAPATSSKQTRVIQIYAVVLGTGLLCSLAIASVYQFTDPIIRRNQDRLYQQASLDLFPGATSIESFHYSGTFSAAAPGAEIDSERIYAAFGPDHELKGLVIEAAASGYQGQIRLLYGYSVVDEAILGIRVLESRETPGIGDRIESDPQFLMNFDRLDVRLNQERSALMHPIELVKPGTKSHPWQLDGITGATISSRAVATMLDRSAALWVPRVRARQTDFRSRTGE